MNSTNRITVVSLIADEREWVSANGMDALTERGVGSLIEPE
jgi:hypothetical protein